MEEYISLTEAADGTPYSQEYLSLLARKGKLYAKKIGRNWYTTSEAVAKYTDDQKAKLLEVVERIGATSDIKANMVSDVGSGRKQFVLEDITEDQEWEAPPRLYRLVSSRTFRFLLGVIGNAFLVGTILAGFFVIGVFGANMVQQKSFGHAKEKSQLDLKYFAAVAGERIGFLDFTQSRLRIVASVLKDTGEKFAEALLELTGVRVESTRPLLSVPLLPSPQAAEPQEEKPPEVKAVEEKIRAREIVERKEIFVPADVAVVKQEILSDVEAANKSLRERFEKSIDDLTFKLSRTSTRTESGIQMVTLTQKLDQLDGTTLKNIKISGASGLTDSDIPNDISITGNISPSSISLSSTLTASSTAKITGDLTLFSNLVFYNKATTTIPLSTINAYSIATSTSAVPLFSLDTLNTRIGIGTTSPADFFSIASTTFIGGALGVGRQATSSGTLITSSIINILGTGTSTFANGIQLSAGCIRGPDNLCVGANPGGSNTQIQYNNNNTLGGATDFTFDSTNIRVGIGTSTPGALFSLSARSGATTNASFLMSGINEIYASSSTSTIQSNIFNALSIGTSTQVGVSGTILPPPPILSIGSSGGLPRVGIGTSTPSATLAIQGLAGQNLLAVGSSSGSHLLIDSFGNIGVGSTTPWAKLSIGTLIPTTGPLFAIGSSSQTALMVDRTTGNVGIGTTSPQASLGIAGGNADSDNSLLLGDASGRSVVRFTHSFVDFMLRPDNNNGNTYRFTNGNSQVGNFEFASIPSGGSLTVVWDVTSGGTNLEVNLQDNTSNIAMCYSGAEITTDTRRILGDCNTAVNADYAEMYPIEQGIDYGEIVVTGDGGKMVKAFGGDGRGNVSTTTVLGEIAQLKHSTQPYQSTIIGITSNNYSDFTSAGYNLPKEENILPVALNGRVPVKVSTESGPIKIGDRITSSSLAGVGMKATKNGVTVGIALESFDGNDPNIPIHPNDLNTEYAVGKILVFVNLGYSRLDINSDNSDGSFGALGSPLNAWSVDQQSGKVNVNFFGSLNLNGNSILNVSKILGMDGRWRIDSDGTMIAVRVITDELLAKTVKAETLCVGNTCITEAELLKLLGKASVASPPMGGETSTTTATSTSP